MTTFQAWKIEPDGDLKIRLKKTDLETLFKEIVQEHKKKYGDEPLVVYLSKQEVKVLGIDPKPFTVDSYTQWGTARTVVVDDS